MDTGVWVYDIETLSNCFTYTAMQRETKEVIQFTIWKDTNELIPMVKHLASVRGLIGFNNQSFDYPVLHYILTEYKTWLELSGDEITSLIYKEAQEVIFDEWSGVKDIYVKIPQLDLFRIWHYNNKARMTSLKKLQIALRYDNVQDMPYKHYEEITTQEQVQEILDYNLNDVDATYEFYLKTIPKIELRKGLYERYGLKCMNYPDSKIGEDLMLKLYSDATDENPRHLRKLRTHRDSFKFAECLPDYTNFTTPEFKALQDYLMEIEVEELKGSFKYSFTYDDFQFDLGTGGIHGCIKSGVYRSTPTHIIVDIDVASLYPSLAIAMGLYPEHLGEEFCKVYEDGIIKPRLKAKKEGDKVMNLGFKLAANSVYGKSNSEYSWLYDPLYTLKTTLGGQLSLCMLSERLMTSVDDLTMLQINTDGLTAIIPRTEKRKFYEQCKAWEEETGLILEYAAYKQMIIRDVNSYIAQSVDGKLKYKGALKPYDEMIKDEEYHKSLSQAIVQKAVAEYFLNDVSIEDTVMRSTDIYDFCKTFNASHGWTCHTFNPETEEVTQRQKTNRYFVSTDGEVFRKCHTGEKYGYREIEIEAGGSLVTIFNKYEELPILDYNIDYDYYINECYKLVHKIDGTEERLLEEERQRKEQERLKKEKQKEIEAREREEEMFLKYCWNGKRKPTRLQYERYVKPWLIDKYGDPQIRE